MKKLLLHILFVSVFILLNSCVEDNVAPPFTGQLNPAAEMLVYFESQGDFVNSSLAPALIDAQEVFSNLSGYLIIDLRSNSDFQNGHIEGAVNILNDSLYNFMKSIDAGSYPKIILVSKNGQSSAYFACLLRLAGYGNVYTLNYGMASWNSDFADVWYSATGDHPDLAQFTNEVYPKYDYSALPLISFDNPGASIQSRVEERIQKTFNAGFTFVPNLPSAFNNYIVCYGSDKLYFAPMFFGELGHLAGTVSYLDSPFFEFRSMNYLQTLPTNKTIYIYDYNGQLSACIAAYLQVLGYDAITILYGYNQIFYSRMIDEPDLLEYAFSSLKIYSFPYVTGN